LHLLTEIAPVAFVPLSLATLLALRSTRFAGWRGPLLGLLAAFVAIKSFDLVQHAYTQVRFPPLWDFKCFWMYGRVAATHHNVYATASYQMYHALLNPGGDAEFNTIGADVGMPYPPPMVLLVYPLGLITNLALAMSIWYVAIFSAIAASIGLLWRRFFASDGWAGLLVAAVLVVALAPTRIDVGLAQVGFFALVLLLLFWGERIPWRAGIWLAPLLYLKPLFALLAIYLAVRRQWTALAAFAGASIALLAISIPLLGPGGFQTYLFHNPSGRYPGSYFSGSSSLYKLLVKFTHDQTHFSLATHPLYVAIVVLSVAGAIVICLSRAREQREICLALLVALGLWLYPVTDAHYCILLLPPICAVWSNRKRLSLPPAAVLGFFTLQYLLLDVRDGASTTGLALALDCVFFGLLALRRPTQSPASEQRSRTTKLPPQHAAERRQLPAAGSS
jgi:hypothetical protein